MADAAGEIAGRDVLRWALARLGPLFWRTLVVAMGYGVAVLVASAVTVSHIVIPSLLPDQGAFGSFHGLLREGPAILFGGIAITFPTALPGFLLTIALAARSGQWDSFRFTVAGGLNALPALLIFGAMGGGPGLQSPYFVFCCFGGGLAGGFAYWSVAESWRGARLSAPGPKGS